MIDYIVGFFYNHRYFRLTVKQTTYYCIIIYLLGLLLDLYLTKTLHFNFFAWSESFHENSTAIVLILVGITLLFITISVYFYNQIHQKKKIKIKLEDIAHIWTNELDEKDDSRVIKEYKHSAFLIRTVNDKIYNSKRIQRFNSEIIINNTKFFKDSELYLITEILSLLDDNLKISSVPSYDKDKENSDLESQNYFKEYNVGKSNVQLLSEVTLVEHTLNVVEEAIKEFNEMEKNESYTMHSLHLATVLITALAHDIGKIRNYKILKTIGFDEVIVKEMHHIDLSLEYFKLFVKNLGFYEENEIVTKAIIEHHKSTLPTAKLSKLLFNADKEARKRESKQIITKLKEDAEEVIRKYEKEKHDKKNNEQIDLLLKQLKEKDELINNLSKDTENEVKEKKNTEKQEISEEEYKKARIIKESKIIEKDAKSNSEVNEFEKLIELIKKESNKFTDKGQRLLMKSIDLLDNPKEFLKSITDEEYIYFTYFGLKELFEKIEEKKIGFEEMKEHRFIEMLKEHDLLSLSDDLQFYQKYEIFTSKGDDELKADVSLMKLSLMKLNLDIDNVISNKEKSDMKIFNIRLKNK